MTSTDVFFLATRFLPPREFTVPRSLDTCQTLIYTRPIFRTPVQLYQTPNLSPSDGLPRMLRIHVDRI